MGAALDSFWRIHAAAWLFIALFGLMARSLILYDFWVSLALTLVMEPLGFCLTALAHKLYLSRRSRPILALDTVLLSIALALCGGFIQMAVGSLVRMTIGGGISPPKPVDGLLITVVYYTFVFIGWSVGYFWIRSDADARAEGVRRDAAQGAAIRAELNQLRLQLDPHFLFNALNTLAAEIPDRPAVALEMTHRIAAYLRYSLDHHDRDVCRLADEIEAVRAYMRIQELRFDDRLECIIDVAPELRTVKVPHLIIQPLVENAVKHGLMTAEKRAIVRVSAGRRGETVVIEVSNPGRLGIGDRDRPALGLANIRRRLELHYPQGHALSLAQAGDLVVARMELKGQTCFA